MIPRLIRTFVIHRYSPNPILFNCLNLTSNPEKRRKLDFFFPTPNWYTFVFKLLFLQHSALTKQTQLYMGSKKALERCSVETQRNSLSQAERRRTWPPRGCVVLLAEWVTLNKGPNPRSLWKRWPDLTRACMWTAQGSGSCEPWLIHRKRFIPHKCSFHLTKVQRQFLFNKFEWKYF